MLPDFSAGRDDFGRFYSACLLIAVASKWLREIYAVSRKLCAQADWFQCAVIRVGTEPPFV